MPSENAATLNVQQNIVAFADPTVNSNPRLKYVDWTRGFLGVSVKNPKSEAQTLDPDESWTVFDGSRSTGIDGTSEFSIELSTLDASKYRFTWTGGTNPVLRTDRALALSGKEVTVSQFPNATATMTLDSGTFAGVITGDIVFIPGTSTGDSSGPFNVINEGFWQVISGGGTGAMTLVRPSGTPFQATTETVTLTDNAQFQAFTSAGVQAGDKVSITAGFATVTRKTFSVTSVTSKWFEISSTLALPNQTGILPGASGMLFYRYAKRYLHIEADQQVVIRVNGSTDSTQVIEPIQAADVTQMGWYDKFGPVWALTIISQSNSQANVTVISAE